MYMHIRIILFYEFYLNKTVLRCGDRVTVVLEGDHLGRRETGFLFPPDEESSSLVAPSCSSKTKITGRIQ